MAMHSFNWKYINGFLEVSPSYTELLAKDAR